MIAAAAERGWLDGRRAMTEAVDRDRPGRRRDRHHLRRRGPRDLAAGRAMSADEQIYIQALGLGLDPAWRRRTDEERHDDGCRFGEAAAAARARRRSGASATRRSASSPGSTSCSGGWRRASTRSRRRRRRSCGPASGRWLTVTPFAHRSDRAVAVRAQADGPGAVALRRRALALPRRLPVHEEHRLVPALEGGAAGRDERAHARRPRVPDDPPGAGLLVRARRRRTSSSPTRPTTSSRSVTSSGRCARRRAGGRRSATRRSCSGSIVRSTRSSSLLGAA